MPASTIMLVSVMLAARQFLSAAAKHCAAAGLSAEPQPIRCIVTVPCDVPHPASAPPTNTATAHAPAAILVNGRIQTIALLRSGQP
jgi:hypothetical protein